MTGIISEMGRDREMEKCLNDFFSKLADYLEKPSQEEFDSLSKIAQETDSIREGYFNVRTNVSSKLQNTVDKLSSGDKTYWARFLFDAYCRRNGEIENEVYSRLKGLSPYAGKILFYNDYGDTFSNLDGTMEFQSAIDDKIKSSGMKIYDADDYLIAFDKSDFKKLVDGASVDWVRCGILGVDEPRKPK